MHEEQLKEGTGVFTSGGEQVGEINRFVLDPNTNKITHIVVQKGWLFAEDRLVPFEEVRSVTEDKVVLKDEIEDFDQLPPFEETHYVPVNERDRDRDLDREQEEGYPAYPVGPAYFWYPPYGYLGDPAYGLAYGWPYGVKERNIPADSVPLQEGTDVVSADGEHVGDVEELFVDDESHMVTHFLVSQGTFFKDRKLVPANWIRSVSEDQVRLNVASELLKRLPAYEAE